MMKDRLDAVRYTLDHRKAFLKVERQCLGHNTFRGFFHDMDKVLLKFFLSKKTVSRLHRAYSRHHNPHTHADYVQMAIDWECARFTKPDKPMTAVETLYALYPERETEMLPVLKELKLA